MFTTFTLGRDNNRASAVGKGQTYNTALMPYHVVKVIGRKRASIVTAAMLPKAKVSDDIKYQHINMSAQR